MDLQKQNVLFLARAPQHGGTENVILQLCEIFHDNVNRIVVAAGTGFKKEELQKYNIKFFELPDIEEKNPMTIFRCMRMLEKIAKDESITVIHTHHRMAAFYVELTGLYKKCVFINTSHNTFYNRRGLTRSAYKKAHLIACGEMVKKNLTDFFGLEDVTVIHNAVKPFMRNVSIDPVLETAKKEGKFLIGNIGRLSEQKGMEYYIQAISEVVKKHPEAQFYIVGSGEDEEKLRAMSNGLPLKFLGYRSDIQNLMTQLDLVVLSSLWEGFPLTPIEAFSVGRTVVATGVDGTLEIVKDGDNGLLVESKNSKDLAEKINWMIEHEDERKRMEESARQSFETEFAFDILAKSYTDYYRSL